MNIKDNVSLLCQMLANFCNQYDLEIESADDLILNEDLTAEQKAWLSAYIQLWDQEV